MSKEKQRTYIAIDLKSFYASVECMERGLNPMTTNLVVADISRTEKTICLAVSPSLKAYGISGRARLFEVVQRVGEVNARRKSQAPGRTLIGSSSDDTQVRSEPSLALDYIVAPPQMAKYMERSTEIYSIYLKYIAPEDIHVYSIDEVFIDVTDYLSTYRCTARELVGILVHDVLKSTGIIATAGVGSNLYLAKIAMDIVAKKVSADKDGLRIAELDEISYRRQLWTHRPLTDFWRVGRGYAKKLEEQGLLTMGDVARCSVGNPKSFYNEELLYKLFGINAELLIDHAWGWEPCTIADIKAYKPQSNSIGSGQVLSCPYTFDKAKLAIREMAELLALDLVEKELVTKQIVLTVGYDIENLTDAKISRGYTGPITTDRYGRKVPKSAHGTENLERLTSSSRLIVEGVVKLFERVVNPKLLVRRMYLTATNIISEQDIDPQPYFEQLDLFTDYAAEQERMRQEETALERERRLQNAMLDIRKRYGKNSILKAMNLQEGATTIERNSQIGGHKA